jgi:hypothetical protein
LTEHRDFESATCRRWKFAILQQSVLAFATFSVIFIGSRLAKIPRETFLIYGNSK